MEHLTDADYIHTKSFFKDFEIKNFSENHDLYFNSDALPLANIFESFREMYLQICHLDLT